MSKKSLLDRYRSKESIVNFTGQEGPFISIASVEDNIEDTNVLSGELLYTTSNNNNNRKACAMELNNDGLKQAMTIKRQVQSCTY